MRIQERLKKKKTMEKCGVTTFIERENFSSSILSSSLYIQSSQEKGIILPRINIDDWLIEAKENATEDEIKVQREERITTFGTLVHKTLEDKIRGIDGDYSSFFKGEKERGRIINEALRLRDSFFNSCFYIQTLKGFS